MERERDRENLKFAEQADRQELMLQSWILNLKIWSRISML